MTLVLVSVCVAIGELANGEIDLNKVPLKFQELNEQKLPFLNTGTDGNLWVRPERRYLRCSM